MALSELLARGVELIIAMTVLEALALGWLHHRRGRGVAPRDFALNLASGLCLMVAVRQALVDGPAASIAVCLMAAGALHALDLWRRWR